MLAAVAGGVAKKAVELGFTLVGKKLEQWRTFEHEVEDIKADLDMIGALEEGLILGEVDPSQVRIQSMEEMRGLAQKIEDSLDGILCYAKLSPLHRFKKVCSHMGSRPFAGRVKELKERLKAAKQRALDFNVNGRQPSTMARLPVVNYSSTQDTDDDSSRCPGNGNRIKVGIKKTKDEILELLADIKGQTEPLRVICIVGFGGSGKSTLAYAVYQEEKERHPSSCWIDARQHKEGLRKSIADQNILRDETGRYLIVLDNIEDQQWDSISSSFSENSRGGIIIVTTTAQYVANICSSHGNGHVYNMTTLDDGDSEDFLKSVLKHKNLSMFEESLKLIVNKCDGHPLALNSMATYLLRGNKFTKEDFSNFWDRICDKMKECQEFRDLEQILMKIYRISGRPLNVRACLLYICAFPGGHLIRRNRLIRRWLAEGYSQKEANECFEKLVEQNIFRTIGSSKRMEVNTCTAHGIVHGFMMHMSKITRFMESANSSERRNYRHLYWNDGELDMSQLPHNSEDNSSEEFHAHSLTICGNAGKKVIGNLPKCKVLRILDLEECADLESNDIQDIDIMWHLKYLSLGPNIDQLPEKIDMLHCLETLDLRKTKIDTVPVVVILLPHLAHLFGKFKLERKPKTDLLEKMKPGSKQKAFPRPPWREVKKLLEKSNLQTLAGFITDEEDNDDRGFASLMIHMKNVNKVKIWCKSTDKCSVGFTALSDAIKKFLITEKGDKSLSLYIADDSSSEILTSLWDTEEIKSGDTEEIVSGYLSSLKLHGALLSTHTQFASFLSGLKELCLSWSNGLSQTQTNNELTNLYKLTMLQYLKLVNVRLAGFKITSEHFRTLLRLHLVQCHGTVPTIEEGALPGLHSLWIFDKDLHGLSKIKIANHKHLQEVALDSGVEEATITSWDEAAKKHPKRPKVLFFKCVGTNGTGPMVKYVASERPAPRLPRKRPDKSSESSSVEQQLSSDFNKRLKCGDNDNMEEAVAADRPRAPTELYVAMDIDVASSSRVMT